MTMRRGAGATRSSRMDKTAQIFLLLFSHSHGDSPHDELYTWNCDAVAEGPVSGGIRSAWYICPAIGKALEPLAFQRCEPSYKLRQFRVAFLGDCPRSGPLCRLIDQVRCVLILLGAFRRSNIIFPETI